MPTLTFNMNGNVDVNGAQKTTAAKRRLGRASRGRPDARSRMRCLKTVNRIRDGQMQMSIKRLPCDPLRSTAFNSDKGEGKRRRKDDDRSSLLNNGRIMLPARVMHNARYASRYVHEIRRNPRTPLSAVPVKKRRKRGEKESGQERERDARATAFGHDGENEDNESDNRKREG